MNELINNASKKEHIDKLLKQITVKSSDNRYRIMEICGTHTVSISRTGLRSILPKNIELISGPGCPVCVTSQGEIDLIFDLISKDLSIITFGDLLRIPSSKRENLLNARSEGADINVIYSPLDAIKIAKNNSTKEYVFVAVGFETTAPLIATLIKEIALNDIGNLSVLSLCKTMPEAIKYILSDDDLQIDGFLAPGHVTLVTGVALYNDIVESNRAVVVAGFEPVEILLAIESIVDQVNSEKYIIDNKYKHVVSGKRNDLAIKMLDDVFEPSVSVWRGIGTLYSSGLQIRDIYSKYNALVKYDLSYNEKEEIKGCKCGAVLTGKISPLQCPLFAKSCTVDNPIGPCMVSSEGTCFAYYQYERLSL